MRKSHSKRPRLANDDPFGISHADKVFGTVFGDISKVTVGENYVE